MIEQLFQIVQADLLLFWRAAQIAIRSHAGTNRAANQSVTIELAFDMFRSNMAWLFDRQLDRLETPLLELFEQLCASIVERGGKQESVKSESHNENRG